MPYTSPNMGLRVWNLLTDPYDHDQLADNMARIDAHDHSPGRGRTLPTEAFSDGAISSAKLGNLATVKGIGAFRAYRNAALSLATAGVVVFDTETFDHSNWFDVGNGRFTPQVAGYYRVHGQIRANAALGAVNRFWQARVLKNAVLHSNGSRAIAHTDVAGLTTVFNDIVSLNGTTDFVEIQIEHDTGGSAALAVGTAPSPTFITGQLVGRS